MTSHPFPQLADNVTSTVENVDGNALAGPLAEFFSGDLTTAHATCRHCGEEAPLATAVVEMDDTAAIVICRGCTHTLFTLHRSPTGTRLELAGLAALCTDPVHLAAEANNNGAASAPRTRSATGR